MIALLHTGIYFYCINPPKNCMKKLLHKIIPLVFPVVMVNPVFAQKKAFDIVSFNAPAGWTEQPGSGNVSYSRIDGGSWAQVAVYEHRSSQGTIQADFEKEWNELVASNQAISSPERTKPQTAAGWTVMSGSGVWQYNGANVATILTVYSNNQVCVSVLCNATAQPYLREYQKLLGSLDLDASRVREASGGTNGASSAGNSPAMNTNSNAIVGLWTSNILESSGGYYANGMPVTNYTAGYFRKEYTFYANGTYQFLQKSWSAYMKEILFSYETGTWSINGNKLTLKPVNGKNESWSKAASGRTVGWGNLIRSTDRKLETITYDYGFHYYSGSNDTSLLLYYGADTERDGTRANKDNKDANWNYSARSPDKALIDLPPGKKINGR